MAFWIASLIRASKSEPRLISERIRATVVAKPVISRVVLWHPALGYVQGAGPMQRATRLDRVRGFVSRAGCLGHGERGRRAGRDRGRQWVLPCRELAGLCSARVHTGHVAAS